MPTAPLRLLIAAAPGDAGTDLLLARALERASRGPVSVMFTGEGLRFLERREVIDRLAEAGVPLALCSRSVRDRATAAKTVPPGVAWSSLTVWLSDAPAGAETWATFP